MKGLVEFFELGVGHADGDVLEVDEKGDFAFVHAASRWRRSDVPVVLCRIVFEVWLAAHRCCSGRLTPNGDFNSPRVRSDRGKDCSIVKRSKALTYTPTS